GPLFRENRRARKDERGPLPRPCVTRAKCRRAAISARSPGGFRPVPAAPSFSAGSCSLSSPEGRPGVLRLGTQGRPQARNPRAPHASGRTRREGPDNMSGPGKPERDRVFICDTTLRDGEQCPGATMTHEEKLEVAELLDQMGVDIIEAGFPIAWGGDFAGVQEIARRTKNAVVCGLARAAFKDIDRCAEAIKPA